MIPFCSDEPPGHVPTQPGYCCQSIWVEPQRLPLSRPQEAHILSLYFLQAVLMITSSVSEQVTQSPEADLISELATFSLDVSKLDEVPLFGIALTVPIPSTPEPSPLTFQLLLVMNSRPSPTLQEMSSWQKVSQYDSELENAKQWEFLNWHPLLLGEYSQQQGILDYLLIAFSNCRSWHLEKKGKAIRLVAGWVSGMEILGGVDPGPNIFLGSF